jgi:uncharacterized protein YciI
MYVVSLTYVAPLDQVDAHLAEHVKFLEEQYAKGIFLASGRKVPRTGGVILARSIPRDQLNGILAHDPFKKAGVAEYQVTEFVASMAADRLSALKEA